MTSRPPGVALFDMFGALPIALLGLYGLGMSVAHPEEDEFGLGYFFGWVFLVVAAVALVLGLASWAFDRRGHQGVSLAVGSVGMVITGAGLLVVLWGVFAAVFLPA